MIRWLIYPYKEDSFIIKYDKRFARTGKSLWVSVKSAIKSTCSDDALEVFPTYEDAEATLELLINDFGGYRVG